MPEARTILVCTANPSETARLRADEEVRSLTSAWERSSSRSNFALETVVAAQWSDLRRALLEYQPTIVHFIGHGALDGKGLAMEKPGGGAQLVPGENLAALFKEFPSLSCVVLNACYSAAQAEVIHQHVPCVVGVNQRLEDEPRIGFAVAFYDGVFAGLTYPKAFALGKTGILSEGGADAFVLHFERTTTPDEPVLGPKKLRGAIKNPVPTPSGAPILIFRDEEIETIIKLLSEDEKCYLLGLYGAAGHGKSVLAQMVCNHRYVQEKFGGGIFWVDIENYENPEQALDSLDDDLKESDNLISVEADTSQPGNGGFARLIVLDSVESSINPFLDKNYINCKWMVITRNKAIFSDRQSQRLGIKPLTAEETYVALLSFFEERDIETCEISQPNSREKVHQSKIKELANLTYEWPVLLGAAMKNIQILLNEHVSPSKSLEESIEIIRDDWSTLDDISSAMERYLNSLSPEDRRVLVFLTIFSAGQKIPLSIAEKVLNLPIKATRQSCLRIAQASLIKKISLDQEYVQSDSRIRKYILTHKDFKERLSRFNDLFVSIYRNRLLLDSFSGSPHNLSKQERKFIDKVYRHHLRMANKYRFGNFRNFLVSLFCQFLVTMRLLISIFQLFIQSLRKV